MNMNPDETKLALWLDDELTGDELAAMDAWAADIPEQLAAREEIRSYRKTMAAALPASEEPPPRGRSGTRCRAAISMVASTSSTDVGMTTPTGSIW